MFISNQAYNICLNLQEEQWQINKDLDKKERKYLKASDVDKRVKEILKSRELPFKTVVTQQARINADKSLKDALNVKGRGFPKFKSSKGNRQSFTWNNQGYQIVDDDNSRFKYLRLWRQDIKLRYHRELPTNYKMNYIVISRENSKYFVSFSITFDKSIDENIDFSKAIGIDLNIKDIALSNGKLIKTNSKKLNSKKYDRKFLILQRKQSRRVLKAKKSKVKLGANFKKTQKKLNKIYEKAKNIKSDKYHKITSELSNKFDLIVVEELQTKNMTKRAKLKNVKQKSGLNKSILNTSFYQFVQLLEYKTTMLNDKQFLKVPPHYTSKTCFNCGNMKTDLKLSDRVYKCKCGYVEHRDINSAKNILKKGLDKIGVVAGTAIRELNESLSNSDSVELVS